MQYNVSNQVNVLIICLLYTISSKEILFCRVIMWEHLMFLVGCLIISSCLVPASFFYSDMDSENISLIWLSVSDSQKTCSSIFDRYVINLKDSCNVFQHELKLLGNIWYFLS